MIIDGKFEVRISKISNGELIPEDEPLFLLRARDKLALDTLLTYKALSLQDGCNNYHLEKLQKVINKFELFRVKCPERMKQPSITKGK